MGKGAAQSSEGGWGVTLHGHVNVLSREAEQRGKEAREQPRWMRGEEEGKGPEAGPCSEASVCGAG